MSNKANFNIGMVVLLGLLVRMLFYFFGAEVFYGKADFQINGDTYSFLQPTINLIEHGVFTLDLNNPQAAFARLPGYSLILAPFYWLFGNSPQLFVAVAWFQLLLDCVSILLVYKISILLFNHHKISILSAFLYAIYPFVIVWTPVVYAETFGIFLLLLIVYALVDQKHPIILGLFIAAGFYVRPQLLFILPAILLSGLFLYKKSYLKRGALIVLGFLLLYLPWPIRNMVNHDSFVPMRDINSMRSWQPDVLYFHKYINGLQPGWEPQMTELIGNGDVEFPEEAYTSKNDSLLLIKAVSLSRNCSDGFASFMRKPPIENACTEETAEAWRSLWVSQMRSNPINYFLVVPIKGLSKALFKFKLITNWKSPKRSSFQMIATSALFAFRSLLIILGIAGLIRIFRRKEGSMLDFTILLYFIIWYFWMCFVTRYLEIRYFLPPDVLLLIPAAHFIYSHLAPFRSGQQA